jgi:allantoin racemase
MERIKIWWQSATVITEFPEYLVALKEHAKKVLNSGTELEVHGVDRGTTGLLYHYPRFLNTHQILENALRAQREGFDAVAIGCGDDPGLDEAREILNIPVLSLSETGMFVACMLGKKFSIITNSELLDRKRMSVLIQQYGLEARSIPGGNLEVNLDDLACSFKNPKIILDRFVQVAKETIDRGAEVIIPGCNILNLVAAQNRIYEIDGVPILDVSGVLMKMTETMVALKKVCGVRVSRRGYFASPSEELISTVQKIYKRP